MSGVGVPGYMVSFLKSLQLTAILYAILVMGDHMSVHAEKFPG